MEPILLLHGALGAQDQFDALAARLSENYAVHRLNFSGHGPDTVMPEAFLPEVFVNDVLQYLAERELDSVNIFGYSMGGYIALMLALRHPERVSAVLTLGTKMDWNPEAAAREAAMLNPDKILEKVPAFAKALQQRHGESRWRTVLEKTAGMMQYLGEHCPLDEAALRSHRQFRSRSLWPMRMKWCAGKRRCRRRNGFPGRGLRYWRGEGTRLNGARWRGWRG